MIDINWVVGRLSELMKDGDTSVSHSGRGENHGSELLLADDLRARESEKNAAGLNDLESLGVETPIALESVLEDSDMLGESGRVEDDEVILLSGVLHEMESVFGESLVPGVGGEVTFDILPSEFDGALGAIDRVDELGAATEGEEREAAGVAESIEDTLAAAILLDECTVVALVDEEARLLPFLPIGHKDETILLGLLHVGMTIDIAVDRVEPRLER